MQIPFRIMMLAAGAVTAPAMAEPLVSKGLSQALQNSRAPADLLLRPTYKPGSRFTQIALTGDVVTEGILSCSRKKLGTRVISEQCMTRNMPLIEQTDPRIPADLQALAAVGCFDTSMLTVLRTQVSLANASVKTEAAPPC